MKNVKNIKKWWSKKRDKPILWKDYANYTKWSIGIVGILYLIVFIWYKIQDRKYYKTEKPEKEVIYD